MSETGTRGSGCLRAGCGCCGIVLAAIFGLLLIGGVGQLARSRSDRAVEQIDRVRDLPVAADQLALATRPRESGVLALPLSTDQEAQTALAAGVGSLRLDLSVGEFRIEPGPVGSQIRIEGDFESDAFTLVEALDEQDDGSWSYSVRFAPKRGPLGLLFGAGNNPQNEITLIIPRGLPLDLVGDIGVGESDFELGGLFIRHVDLDFGAGDHTIRFSEPLEFAMEDFEVGGSIGALRVADLGNASPIRAEVEHRIGEAEIDLNGSWTGDAELVFDVGIGESRVRVPDDVHVDVERSGVGLGEEVVRPPKPADDLSDAAPRLKIRLSGGIGEVRITG